MTTTTKTVTAEDLLAMGEKARWLELIDGELHPVSPANIRHGNIAVRIATILDVFVTPRSLGYVVVEAGFVLQRNPDTVLGPDVSFLRKDRAPDGLPEKFFEGHPDLAVEIISPRNPRPEQDRKMRLYMTHGTPLGWLVDPRGLTVEIYRPNRPIEKLSRDQTITGENVLPGLACTVADFFA